MTMTPGGAARLPLSHRPSAPGDRRAARADRSAARGHDGHAEALLCLSLRGCCSTITATNWSPVSSKLARKSMNNDLTIGHSDHSLDEFLNLLVQHRISALADAPRALLAAPAPVFQACARRSAGGRGIAYVYLGEQRG